MIPIDTHQPVDASPRAISSAARSATCGGSSNPPTSAGAPARNSPLSRSIATSSSGRRRAVSISLHSFRAASAICRRSPRRRRSVSWFSYVTTTGSTIEPVRWLNHG